MKLGGGLHPIVPQSPEFFFVLLIICLCFTDVNKTRMGKPLLTGTCITLHCCCNCCCNYFFYLGNFFQFGDFFYFFYFDAFFYFGDFFLLWRLSFLPWQLVFILATFFYFDDFGNFFLLWRFFFTLGTFYDFGNFFYFDNFFLLFIFEFDYIL